MHIHALGLEAWAESVPVDERWKKYDALSVRETSTGEPTDGAAEKILVLVEQYDVIAWGSIRHHLIPGLTVHHQLPPKTGGCELHEEHLLDDRLKPVRPSHPVFS
jgi:hypothetical protein